MSYALITGASKGIGKALAFELAEKGHDLLLTARSRDLLEALAGELKSRFRISVEVFPADLSLATAPKEIADWVTKNNFGVDILINNAGYGSWGFFDELTLPEQLNMMQLNMNAVVSLCHLFIPILRKNNKAWLMNVSSTSSYQAVPTTAVYSASKAFVLTFTRGLQMELQDSVIQVSCLVPGTTDSNFIERANMDELKAIAAKFSMPAEKVAKVALRGMFKGKVEIVPGFTNRISYAGTKFLPKRVVENIAAGIYHKPLKKKRKK